jgi:predicted O-methyltransferase YrrM
MMDRKIEKYITDHSTAEDPLLEELYRETHIRFVNPNMVSGHLQGKLLELLVKMIKPSVILEIGTFTGYSAISMARGLEPGARIYTIEINDELHDFSNSYFSRAGVSELIVSLSGKAQDAIPSINEEFDLVFIDGDKREYKDYFNLVIGKLKRGGFIIADNVLWGNKVLDASTNDQQTRGIMDFNEMISRRTDVEKLIIPLRDGLMIIRKM